MTSVGPAGYRSEARTAAGGRSGIMDPMNGNFHGACERGRETETDIMLALLTFV
jgi:hypothetical protein